MWSRPGSCVWFYVLCLRVEVCLGFAGGSLKRSWALEVVEVIGGRGGKVGSESEGF